MSGTLFDRFTNVWNRKQEARVAELEKDFQDFQVGIVAELADAAPNEGDPTDAVIAGVRSLRAQRDDLKERNAALAEELAPFRAFVREHEAQAEARDGEEGGGEEGPEAEEVEEVGDEQPRDERGRFTAAEPEAAT